jgi:hypothetical protein
MKYSIEDLETYSNGGFELNKPDYVFNNFEFIGTCGSFPEQYDIVLNVDNVRVQAGYVRLRGGRLQVSVPDTSKELIHSVEYTKNKGSFATEEERVNTLKYVSDKLHSYYFTDYDKE